MKKKILALSMIFIMVLAMTACGKSGGSGDQETWNLKFSFEGREGIRMSQLWKEWADMITEKTDGRVTFTFYYDSTLLDANGEYAQLTAGVADIADIHRYASDGFTMLEKWKGFTMGTPIEGQVAITKALFEEFPELQEETSGIHPLAYAFDGGTYQLLTVNKEVDSVDDMKGLVIWCEADFNDFVKGMGATPVNTPWSEVYSSLQKNMYDGLLIAAETLESVNFAEVCQYCTMVNLNYLTQPGHFMNLDVWNSLPDDIKAVFNDEEVVNFIESNMEKSAHESEEAGIQWAIDNHGTKVIELSDEEQQKFVDVLNESKKSIAAAFDAEGLPGTEILNRMIELSKEYQ